MNNIFEELSKMAFGSAYFIKPDVPFLRQDKRKTYAPMFRKKFKYSGTVICAELSVCGLGYGYYWINGKKVTEDLFTAPVSNYTKTVWYQTYDVTRFINEGENVIAIICGNGWYNEIFTTPWKYNEAAWRDVPKFILKLTVNGVETVLSDESWKCSPESAIIYNQLRSGEHFDARLFDESWTEVHYDDDEWENVVKDQTPPAGVFRKCLCEPIRECALYPAKEWKKTGQDRWVFDIGQNISGYVRLHVKGKRGTEIKIRYAEELNEDASLKFNGMESFYPESVFQEDRFICSGEDFTWSPLFAYHGFRYVELTGLEEVEQGTVTGVFVHQAVRRRSAFECSDPFLNKLFYVGQMSTLSNLFYMPTDCPTREKLGWANDAQASADQMLMNFETEALLRKWMVDICDAMKDDGALPGIIPTPGWGYQWGNGPVSDGVLFEIPYRIYLYTGDRGILCDYLPYFKKYLSYLESRINPEGFVEFGLDDWAAPYKERKVCAEFVNALLLVKFLHITSLSERLSGGNEAELQKKLDRQKELILKRFIGEDGACCIKEQTAVAMLIYYGIYRDLKPLKEQLKELVEQENFHHCCGMVGLQYLYDALNKCGLEEYAFRIITASGFPSYREWMECGATTLGEYWDMSVSKNHHMYSGYMSWMMKTIIGIRAREDAPGYQKVEIAPYFFKNLNYAKGSCNTVRGKITVEWKRQNRCIELIIDIPETVDAFYKGQKLLIGRNQFVMKGN